MNSNFQESFSNAVYQATGKFVSSQTFCHVDVKRMFSVIEIGQGFDLLKIATIEKQFHPDSIEVYAQILKSRRTM